MKSEVYQQIQRLDHLFELAKDFGAEEQLANWARYLCILTSGLIENSARAFAVRYAEKTAGPNVQRFLSKNVQSLTNMNSSKLHAFLCSFSPDWGDLFESKLSDQQRDTIDSIVANRNNIAHGSDVGISFVTMRDYYENVKIVIDVLDFIMNPGRA